MAEHLYFLLQLGREVASGLTTDAPALEWYVTRTKQLVALVDGLGGTQLKNRQYLLKDYAETSIGRHIAPIADQARERLARLKACQPASLPSTN
ncbi:hypothetical protein ACFVYE_05025 [Streptomyces sp. NPDC058239]|uniref:hypothetical protein n=1 Tax=Streptomyces sp. NPDC058239 TaxID=3346395 RepID=UPI0036E2DC18